MSLYNMVRGFNVNARLCLAMLGIDPAGIPRFRDAWLSDDGANIVVLTRTGGGNRPDYENENQSLREVAGFVGDHDDSFDSTFAHFLYQTPERFKADAALIAEVVRVAGKGAEQQGPAAIMLALEPDKAPKAEITEDDPRFAAAVEAFDRIVTALQQRAP